MDNLLALAGALALIIAIVSLFKPDLTLRWASEGKKTRLFGLFFWFFVCLVCWIAGTAISHFSQSALWVALSILCVCVIAFGLYLHKFNSARAETQRRKIEAAEQRKLAVQAQKEEKERQRQEQLEARKAEKEQQRKEAAKAEARARRAQQRRDAALTNAILDDPYGDQVQIYRRIETAYDNGEFDDPDDQDEIFTASDDYREERDFVGEWSNALKEHFGKKMPSEISEKLRKKFGKNIEQAVFNYYMYDSRLRKGQTYCVVPKDDYYRRRFDALAQCGASLKFKSFEPELLNALSMSQLRDVGRATGLKSLRVGKAGSLKMLLELSEETLAQAWPAAGVELDSIFQLRKLDDIYEEVKGTE